MGREHWIARAPFERLFSLRPRPRAKIRPGNGGLGVTRKERIRAWSAVTSIACIPVLGTLLAVVSTTEQDLSDLIPVSQPPGQPVLIEWSALGQSQISQGLPVRALGYMLEAHRPVRAGDWVGEFVLVPEAGNLLHPAHRFSDQTIAVHLRDGDKIRFSPRALTWVWGRFQALPGDPAGPQPLYALHQSRARIAEKSDIRKFFK